MSFLSKNFGKSEQSAQIPNISQVLSFNLESDTLELQMERI